MNKLVKKIGSLALVSTLVLGTNLTQAYASNKTVNVAIDGRLQVFPDVEPFLDNNARTQVPIRFVSEKLGADVEWNGKTQTAIIKKDGKTVEMAIGQSKIVVNGTTTQMDTSPTLYQGRTVVPLRYVSEGLGVGVNYDSNKNLVEITTSSEITLPEPKFDIREQGSKEGYGTSYDSIEFPVIWAKQIAGKDTVVRQGIIYDITLKNGNEVWLTTNQYMGSINVANEPIIRYVGLTFYNSKTGDSHYLVDPKGVYYMHNKPEITYNADGTITYMLETYQNDNEKYPNNDFTSYSKYDRVKIGTTYGYINIPVSSLIK